MSPKSAKGSVICGILKYFATKFRMWDLELSSFVWPEDICPFSALNCNLRETCENPHLFDLAFAPKTPACPMALFDVLDCFLDIAIGHWLGCLCATEPKIPEDMEWVWLIDLLVDWLIEEHLSDQRTWEHSLFTGLFGRENFNLYYKNQLKRLKLKVFVTPDKVWKTVEILRGWAEIGSKQVGV